VRIAITAASARLALPSVGTSGALRRSDCGRAAGSAAQWQGAVAQEVTIQVRPGPGRDTEADVARAVALAREAPGIAGSAGPAGRPGSRTRRAAR
jgi:hypothetical protein